MPCTSKRRGSDKRSSDVRLDGQRTAGTVCLQVFGISRDALLAGAQTLRNNLTPFRLAILTGRENNLPLSRVTVGNGVKERESSYLRVQGSK